MNYGTQDITRAIGVLDVTYCHQLSSQELSKRILILRPSHGVPSADHTSGTLIIL